MPDTLRILYVCSEVAPLIKTGGLADVSYALPVALHEAGHDVRVVLPCYSTIPREYIGESVGQCEVALNGHTEHAAIRRSVLPRSDVPLYLIEHDGYYHRGHPYNANGHEFADNLERFSFFSLAALAAVRREDWQPDVVSCHDWHTGLLPVHLRTRYAGDSFWDGVPTTFTIHNIGYQGQYGADIYGQSGLDPSLFHPGALEYFGDINMMKGGIVFADKVSTVSPTYATEILRHDMGYGLDSVLRSRRADLYGILNGIDPTEWDPASDSMLSSPFSAKKPEGKVDCKRALQDRCGLPQVDVPVFGLVSRLVWEKGIDMLFAPLERLLGRHDAQVVILGSGEPGFEEGLSLLANRFPEKMAVHIGYDNTLAHQIYGGADFYLMPSRMEPCGLSQLYAMRYGTLPIVRRTGGLADTVTDSDSVTRKKKQATGFVFLDAWDAELDNAMARALRLFGDKAALKRVRETAMTRDFTWKQSAETYVDMFREAIRSR